MSKQWQLAVLLSSADAASNFEVVPVYTLAPGLYLESTKLRVDDRILGKRWVRRVQTVAELRDLLNAPDAIGVVQSQGDAIWGDTTADRAEYGLTRLQKPLRHVHSV